MSRDQIVGNALVWFALVGLAYWIAAALVVDGIRWAAERQHGKHRPDADPYTSRLDRMDGVTR